MNFDLNQDYFVDGNISRIVRPGIPAGDIGTWRAFNLFGKLKTNPRIFLLHWKCSERT